MKKNETNIELQTSFLCAYKKEPPHLPPRLNELKTCKGLWDGKSESSSLAYALSFIYLLRFTAKP